MIRGVTTAAALWVTTIIGLAFGAGLLELGGVTVILVIFTLFVLPYSERWFPSDWYGSIEITVKMDGVSDIEIKDRVEQLGVIIKSVALNYDIGNNRRTICCQIKLQGGQRLRALHPRSQQYHHLRWRSRCPVGLAAAGASPRGFRHYPTPARRPRPPWHWRAPRNLGIARRHLPIPRPGHMPR